MGGYPGRTEKPGVPIVYAFKITTVRECHYAFLPHTATYQDAMDVAAEIMRNEGVIFKCGDGSHVIIPAGSAQFAELQERSDGAALDRSGYR